MTKDLCFNFFKSYSNLAKKQILLVILTKITYKENHSSE